MISIFVRYRVKEGKIEDVKKIVREFVTKVKDNEPETLVYESYQLEDDEQEFAHFVKFATVKSEKNHNDTEYMKKFRKAASYLCERTLEFIKLEGFY